MKRARSIGVILALAGFLCSKDVRAQKELIIQLAFDPQEGVHTVYPDLPAALLDIAFEQLAEDGRRQEDPRIIGQATGRDDRPFPVRADRDPVMFVSDTLAAVAGDWSLQLDKPAPRTLRLQIMRFWVNESRKAVGSMYNSDVRIAFQLTDGAGQTIAEGVASGSAGRYGRAHSIANANEVLSDALKEAYGNVLGDTALQSAWVSGKRTTAATSRPDAAQESVEERLRKLDDLLKKGLVTKEEHSRKRAEILKDL